MTGHRVRRVLKLGALATTLAMVLSLASVTSAYSLGDEPSGVSTDGTDYALPATAGVTGADGSVTQSGTVRNWSGQDAVGDPNGTTTIVGSRVSAPAVATASMVKADSPSYVSSTGQSLAAAAAASTVYVKTWSQWNCSHLGCVFWKKTHSGRAYYNGTSTWTRSRLGYTGYHSCSGWSAVGYSVSDIKCNNYGSDPATANTSPNHQHLQDNYTIHFTVKGSPLSNSLWQYANIYRGGTMYFHWKVK